MSQMASRVKKPSRRQLKWDPGYRVPGECDRCPACASHRIRLLDLLGLRRNRNGKRIGFITGCETCGLVFANPMPTPTELETFYGPDGHFASERTSNASTAARAGISRSKLRLLFGPIQDELDVLVPPAGARVLDFGCGDGGVLNSLQDLGWATHGVEPSSQTAFTRHTELRQLPTEPTFDLVFLHHVLEYLGNPFDIIKGLAGCMRDGGFIYISVPRLDTLPEHGDLQYCIQAQNHIVSYTADCMQTLLALASLSTVAILDAPEYDARLTQGRPIRLRLLAKKTAGPVTGVCRPLRPARRALSEYRQRHGPPRSLLDRLAPIRLRASLANAARRARKRDRARAPSPQ